MRGSPKYNYGDLVLFHCNDTNYTGTVYIVDKWGTFENSTEPSYDIHVGQSEIGPCLFKHISEPSIIKLISGVDETRSF